MCSAPDGRRTAIASPRIHLEEGVLHLEPPLEPGRVPYEAAQWRTRNLYFGSVAAVERLPDGTLAAAGDPRRGAGVVVGLITRRGAPASDAARDLHAVAYDVETRPATLHRHARAP